MKAFRAQARIALIDRVLPRSGRDERRKSQEICGDALSKGMVKLLCNIRLRKSVRKCGCAANILSESKIWPHDFKACWKLDLAIVQPLLPPNYRPPTNNPPYPRLQMETAYHPDEHFMSSASFEVERPRMWPLALAKIAEGWLHHDLGGPQILGRPFCPNSKCSSARNADGDFPMNTSSRFYEGSSHLLMAAFHTIFQ